MSISITGSTNTLLKQLESSGLSVSKAKLVQSELAASGAKTSGSTAAPGITPAVRAAFETKIAADVSSGKLSATDAAAVRKTIGNLSTGSTNSTATGETGAAAAGTAQSSGPAKGGGGGGGGGGDDSSTKTELSELVTLSGSTITTVITYTDGTTSSTSTTATEADRTKYGKSNPGELAGSMGRDYSSSIDKGMLVDDVA